MIDKIEFRSIQVIEATAELTKLQLIWTTVCEEKPYKGDYSLEFLLDGVVVQRKEKILDSSFSGTTTEPLDLTKDYRIRVTATENGKSFASELQPLLLHTVENVSGHFSGSDLFLSWKTDKDIRRVNVQVGDVYAFFSEHDWLHLLIPVSELLLSDEKETSVVITPYCSDISEGPPYKTTMHASRSSIESISSSSQGDKGICLRVGMTKSPSSSVKLRAALSLRYGRMEVAHIYSETAEGNVWLFTIPEDIAPSLRRLETFQAHVAWCGPCIDGIFFSEGIPLAIPKIENLRSDSLKTVLEWSCSTTPPPSCFEVNDGSKTVIVDEARAEILFSGNYKKSITIRPRFGKIAGIPVSISSLFQPGFFVKRGDKGFEIRPGINSPSGNESITLAVPGTLFSTQPASAVSGGAYTLSPASEKTPCLLTWKASESDDIDNFLQKLSEAGILPEGMLLIQEALGRVTPCIYGDLLRVALGFDHEKRCIDLRPGMALSVETEQYKPVVSPMNAGGEFLPGFLPGSSLVYELGCSGTGTLWKTHFNTFLNKLGSGFLTRETLDSLERRNGGGGMIDLFADSFRHAFYRLRYPEGFIGSQSCGTDYAPGNACLFGAQDYTTLMDLPGEGAEAAAQFYFRGRTVLIPLIHIWWNGRDVHVPAGTSLADLLKRSGYALPAPDRVRLQRSLGSARLWDKDTGVDPRHSLPVHFDTSGGDASGWADLPLVGGDRIEF